jgi:hypothetical protein
MQRAVGNALLGLSPWLMKFLSVAGTAAMFLVGGGIIVHAIPLLGGPIEQIAHRVEGVPTVGPLAATVGPMVASLIVGVVVGALLVGAMALLRRLRR